MNANWIAGADGADGDLELMIVTSDDRHHVVAPSPAAMTALVGVAQDPAGDEGFRLGGWVGLIKDRPGVNQLALDDAMGAEALLLGRRSYEWFAERWPARTGELADRLNSLPKYVVSSTLEDADW